MCIVGCGEKMAMVYLERHINYATDHPGIVAFSMVLFGYMAGEHGADLLAKSHTSWYFLRFFIFLFASVLDAVVLTQTIRQLRSAGDTSLVRKSAPNGSFS